LQSQSSNMESKGDCCQFLYVYTETHTTLASMRVAWSHLHVQYEAQCGYVFLQNCYIRTSILVGNDYKLSTTTPYKQNLAKDDLRGIDKANPTKRHPKNERRIECFVMLLHINGICVYSASASSYCA